MAYLRKYNTTLASGTAGADLVRVSIRIPDGTAYATSSEWTPGAGDVKVSKDGGTQANIATLPSFVNGSWEFTLSNTELSAKNVRVIVTDAAVEPFDFTIETFGNASAMWPTNYDGALQANTTQLAGQTVTAGAGVTFPASVGTSNFAGTDETIATQVREELTPALARAESKSYDQSHTRQPWPGSLSWIDFGEGSGTTSEDLSGNGNSVTLTGSPTWGATDPAPISQRFATGGYIIGGASKRIAIANILDTVPDAWTLQFRFRLDAAPTGNVRLWTKYNISDSGGFDCYFLNSDGKLHLTTPGASTPIDLFSANSVWDQGRWFKLTIPYAKGEGYEMWLDDVLVASTTEDSKPPNGTANALALGSYSSGASIIAPITGAFGAVRYFPRKLNPQQIVALGRREPEYPSQTAEDKLTSHGVVMVADAVTDEGALQEPTVLYNTDASTFEAHCHAGWTGGFFRFLSSADGITWTRGANILGDAVGGESSDTIGRGCVVKKGNTYYRIYDDNNISAGEGGINNGVRLATSTSMAGPFTTFGTIIPNSAVSAYGTYIVGPAAYWDDEKEIWIALAQVRSSPAWLTIRLTTTDPTAQTGWTIDEALGVIRDFSPSPAGATYMAGGYCLSRFADGRYVFYPHTALTSSSLPTQGRMATSYDSRHWAMYPVPVRQVRNEIALQDQVADLWVLYVETTGLTYIYYNATNNTGGLSGIALCTYRGTPEELFNDGPAIDVFTGLLARTRGLPPASLSNSTFAAKAINSNVAPNLDRPTSELATPDDVQVTVEPTPVTVNPTTLDNTAVTAIRDGLAQETTAQATLDAVGAIEGGGSGSEDIAAIKAQTDLITTGQLTVISPFARGMLTIRRGDSYGTTSGQTLPVPKPSGASWPDLTDGWVVTLTASKHADNDATGTATLSKACVVVDDDNVRIDLLASDTTALALGLWRWELQATKAELRTTLISGAMRVLEDLATA